MTWGILFGFGASIGWGVSSFFAGQQARRLPSMVVTVWSQFGGALILLLVLLGMQATPTIQALGWGALAGLFGSTALLLFYRGMAIGQVSTVTAIGASGALVPVFYGIIRGERTTPLHLLGMVMVLAGVAIVAQYSRAQRIDQHTTGSSILYALGAALCFGMFYIVADQGTSVANTTPLWVTFGGRASGLAMLLAIQLLWARQLPWPGHNQVLQLGLIGVIDVSATAMFTLGTLAPNLGVVAVLGSLYPVVTILLSRLIINERLSVPQLLGIGIILVGIVFITLP